jgi:uncharacterized protein (UPF0216 family)
MEDIFPSEQALSNLLKDEISVLNSQLPLSQKTLSSLLKEKYAYVMCKDGTGHMFKMKELEYLANLLQSGCQSELFLPIMIEISRNMEKIEVVCRNNLEEELLSKIIGSKIIAENHRIPISTPQFSLLRQILKTTTQYVFSVK